MSEFKSRASRALCTPGLRCFSGTDLPAARIKPCKNGTKKTFLLLAASGCRPGRSDAQPCAAARPHQKLLSPTIFTSIASIITCSSPTPFGDFDRIWRCSKRLTPRHFYVGYDRSFNSRFFSRPGKDAIATGRRNRQRGGLLFNPPADPANCLKQRRSIAKYGKSVSMHLYHHPAGVYASSVSQLPGHATRLDLQHPLYVKKSEPLRYTPG
jgi:hypothetical protein